jgi:hypothetical protein
VRQICRRVILPWLRRILPLTHASFRNRIGLQTPAVVLRQKGSARISAAASLLEICHIALAGVTLLATIASATHEIERDSNFVTLISHQNLAARVSTLQGEKFAGAVTPDSSLADENTERKAQIPVSTSAAKGQADE